ncbi:MAG: type III secretion system inner membrane ring subunit SctD [Deltaproteobacteria bacterium]|jgi:type III secretion protein D|nr:type III secretion system inner membrane ring subunit SctD [Deltaproteobacteria bacterium]
MNERPAALEFRVVSGPNVGARLSLESGQYVFGSSDEADFVFADPSVSPRHMELTIAEAGPPAGADGGDETAEGTAGFSVVARPLDGPVGLDGVVLPPEGEPVAEGRFLTLGFTALTYRRPGQAWGPIDLIDRSLALKLAGDSPAKEAGGAGSPAAEAGLGASAGEEAAAGEKKEATGFSAEEERAALSAAGEAQAAGQAQETDEVDGTDEEVDEADSAKRKNKGSSVKTILFALILAVVLFFLVFDFGDRETVVSQEDELSRTLAANGFGQLSVVDLSYGLEVEGFLNDDQELARLVELVKNRPVKTFLRISIRHDVFRAAQEALTSYGFFPKIVPQENGEALVSVYMLDAATADRAFAELARDVPDFRPVRKVVDRTVIEPLLNQALLSAGLTGLELVFRPGRVDVQAPRDFDAMSAVASAFQEAANRAQTPIRYDLLTGFAAPEAAASVSLAPPPPALPASLEAAGPSEPEGDSNAPLSSLKIVGVTTEPMRFISTRDGHKLFEGSALSGGWIIDSITAESIVLTRDDDTLTYSLEGLIQ